LLLNWVANFSLSDILATTCMDSFIPAWLS
jgi:hypothetical protein